MDLELLETRIHQRTNEVRQSRGWLPLALDPDLERVARYHSQRMAHVGRIFHKAPDGETLSDRLEKQGYDILSKARGQSFCHNCGADLRAFTAPNYCGECGVEMLAVERSPGVSGENVAVIRYTAPKQELPSEYEIAVSVVDRWLNSPGHRENLLDDRFEREAIGIALTEQSGTQLYITQHFS